MAEQDHANRMGEALRKILGPRRIEEEDSRILINHEVRDLTEGEDTVGFGPAAHNKKNHELETSRGETKRWTKDKMGRPDTRGH
jgi:hypothetical protein